MNWMPIETAPYADFDNTYPLECLVWSRKIGGVRDGRVWRYADGEAVGRANGYHGEWGITHWMPLPEPPTDDLDGLGYENGGPVPDGPK